MSFAATSTGHPFWHLAVMPAMSALVFVGLRAADWWRRARSHAPGDHGPT